jgi:hypothetical protein
VFAWPGFEYQLRSLKLPSLQPESLTEAIRVARPLAQKAEGELRIHGTDNRIRESRSYGNDPHPPKG